MQITSGKICQSNLIIKIHISRENGRQNGNTAVDLDFSSPVTWAPVLCLTCYHECLDFWENTKWLGY